MTENDIDAFVAAPPTFEFAFAIEAGVGPIQDLGRTARGHCRVIDILGGEVDGPAIRSMAGGLVHMQNEGLRVANPAILVRISSGETVLRGPCHFRTAPKFETAEPSLS